MNDDIDERVRDSLRDVPLPAAPDALRGYVAGLASSPPSIRSQRRARQPALVAAALVILVAGIGAILITGSTPRPTPAVIPSSPPADSSAPEATPGPSVGFRRFAAPGISFDFPAGWVDQSDVVERSTFPGLRFVAALTEGVTLCPGPFSPGVSASPRPGICDAHAAAPGSMILWVFEYPNQLPGQQRSPSTTTIAGYPAWGGSMPQYEDQFPNVLWIVEAPDGGLYYVAAEAPKADLESRRAEVQVMLSTLQLSPWSIPEEAVNGRVHLDFPQGFSFDYPAGWSVYYSQRMSMMSSLVVDVSNTPLVATGCSDPSSCQPYTIAPDTIGISFDYGGLVTDWSIAPITIDGHPAFHHWGPEGAPVWDEGGFWTVRLADGTPLSIHANIRGPDLVALRATLDEVIGSVRITPMASPSP
jgi:hypothetical protein